MAYPLNVAPPPLGPGLSRIVVSRPPTARGGMRAYTIRVDGTLKQKIRPRQYAIFDQPSGHYSVDARIGWTGSEEVGVDVFAGSVVYLRVEPGGSPLDMLWQIFTPRGYLRLTVVEPPIAEPAPG